MLVLLTRIKTRTFLFIILFLAISSEVSGISFVDSVFEKLDLPTIESESLRLRNLEKRTPSQTLRLMKFEFFWAEALEFRGRIHSANEVQDVLAQRCARHLPDKFAAFKGTGEGGSASYLCAMNASYRIQGTNPLMHASRVGQIEALVLLGEKLKADKIERFYALGRIYFVLPARMGRRVGKSLLNFHLLGRLNSDTSSVNFWLGRIYQIQGNEQKAKEHFGKALSAGDARATLFFGGKKYYRNPDHLDGISWGIHPALFFNPTAGFGGSVVWHDHKIFDTDRRAQTALSASTNGFYGIGLQLEDRVSLSKVHVILETSFGKYVEEFYGLGVNSLRSNFSRQKVQRFEGSVGFRSWFLNYFFLEVGWSFATANVLDSQGGIFAGTSLPDKLESSHTGVGGTLGFDSRDSQRAPRRGLLFQVEGYFPSTKLGSRLSFEKWRVDGAYHVPLARRHTASLLVGLESLTGSVPYSEFVRLGGAFGIPGARAGRYQEKNGMASVAVYRYEAWQSASVIAFGSLGSVAPEVGQLWSVSLKAGGGAGLIFHPARFHAPTVQIEAGVFGSEFNFRAGGSVRF